MVQKESHRQPRLGTHKKFRMSRYRTSEGKDNGVFVWFWCPGCKEAHCFRIKSPTMETNEGPIWAFDYNYEKPSFTPSLLLPGKCHVSLRQGMLVYHADSAHELAGQTVELPDAPEDL